MREAGEQAGNRAVAELGAGAEGEEAAADAGEGEEDSREEVVVRVDGGGVSGRGGKAGGDGGRGTVSGTTGAGRGEGAGAGAGTGAGAGRLIGAGGGGAETSVAGDGGREKRTAGPEPCAGAAQCWKLSTTPVNTPPKNRHTAPTTSTRVEGQNEEELERSIWWLCAESTPPFLSREKRRMSSGANQLQTTL